MQPVPHPKRSRRTAAHKYIYGSMDFTSSGPHMEESAMYTENGQGSHYVIVMKSATQLISDQHSYSIISHELRRCSIYPRRRYSILLVVSSKRGDRRRSSGTRETPKRMISNTVSHPPAPPTLGTEPFLTLLILHGLEHLCLRQRIEVLLPMPLLVVTARDTLSEAATLTPSGSVKCARKFRRC